MRRTWRSLFYLAGYLIPTGLFMALAPQTTLKLLLSNREYDDVFPRIAGLLFFGLGIIVVQIIRYRAEALYSTTLAVRAVLLVGFLAVYWHSHDPLFLVMSGVVGLGIIFTGTSYLLDRRERR